jgi:tRNA wybutosine-synthesizing protein 1
LIDLWHEYRQPIIIAALSILVVLRFLLRSYFEDDTPGKITSLRGAPVADIKKLPEKPQEAVKRGNGSKVGPKRIVGKRKENGVSNEPETFTIQPWIFFASIGGSTEAAATDLGTKLETWVTTLPESSRISKPSVLNLAETELDDYFISPPKSELAVKHFYMILSPSYDIDTSIHNFLEHLQETHHDFRIDTGPLSGLAGYSVFGFGDKESWPTEEEGFCSQAKEIDKWMAKLTARKRAFPLGMGDTSSDLKLRLEEWTDGVKEAMQELQKGDGLGEGVPGSGAAEESDFEGEEADEGKNVVLDVEDLGKSIKSKDTGPIVIDFTTYKTTKSTVPVVKEMVPNTGDTYKQLTKQGYTIVGSHSGVKICRWTKSALRGRGSCYKYSFYGIKSHLCMEMTPSLSCSNKCVFCWRHGTNPVGTTWRWVVDPPEMIFEGAKEGHYKKIKMLKGVPGVRAERFAEAMRIKHCALSLVGEPIFYPHINEFVGMLHKDHISTFLVCNAQHPDQLEALDHVTQLYVSIDASNKESLRKIDRPLHRDFWERFLRCLDILREKRNKQRTVFRLTLVKGFNIEDEAEGYADLVERGLPCFVEVKGVTYCGTSTSSSAGILMSNVPFYEEVCEFVEALMTALEKRGLKYGIAAEHSHSCCILLASERFNIEGKWHTLIDYAKFFECLESGEEFGPEDYVGEPTPEWALWGNGGFDPRDERFYRKNRKIVTREMKS